ncbi:MAG: 2OG-Fe(II) oxygenase [Lautropia sp.]
MAPRRDCEFPAGLDADLEAGLDARGYAILPGLLDPSQCRALAAAYDDPAPVSGHFRSRVVMARHGFGLGEYRYWGYPLPPVVERLRQALYPPLVGMANRWQAALGRAARFPATLTEWLEQCHRAGQQRPTPLLLRYRPGDYNCLHQDLYGEHVFPLQATILLSVPGHDFTGGEFVLTEQRPRRQSRASVAPLQQGDGIVFAVAERPVHGSRGWYRVNQRHGVSEVRQGARHALGVILHDAS